MLILGAALPLAPEPEGVAVPEWLAGVPVTGRLLEMMPVLVRWNVTAGVESSVSS